MAGETTSEDSRDSVTAEDVMSSLSTPQQLPKLETIKLTESTYILWKHQVLIIIEGYGLLDFLFEHTTPPKDITNTAGQRVVNPVFSMYLKQDKLLASWLMSTVSADVLPHLTGLRTARAIWSSLSRLYAARSTAKQSSLRHSLHSQKKRGLTVTEYLAKIKLICDSLNASGNIVSEQEQVSVILSGLTAEFESVLAIASKEPQSLENLTEMLIDCEMRQKDFLAADFSVQANVAVKQDSKRLTTSEDLEEEYSVANASLTSSGFSKGDQRASNSYRGRGRGCFNSNRPQCQICERFGHLAQKCWYRYEQGYPGNGSGNNVSKSNYNV
ncbi:hypothetical protein HRI_003215700 [Hibiscus trionum]|uniref:Retrotransposon Copia-like N-terminal domain-containing protein n=1 Tax=Hibiscus trionum TaxID=183268 RepID=A0A9W7MCQ0_HIBTR|nr:hypothetical protein HRI_003215700 [Hibiscus trionum]